MKIPAEIISWAKKLVACSGQTVATWGDMRSIVHDALSSTDIRGLVKMYAEDTEKARKIMDEVLSSRASYRLRLLELLAQEALDEADNFEAMQQIQLLKLQNEAADAERQVSEFKRLIC